MSGMDISMYAFMIVTNHHYRPRSSERMYFVSYQSRNGPCAHMFCLSVNFLPSITIVSSLRDNVARKLDSLKPNVLLQLWKLGLFRALGGLSATSPALL